MSDIRKLEWRCAPELKLKFGLSSFVNINNGDLTFADSDTRHLMNCLCYVLVCLALSTGAVTYSGNGEDSWPLGNPTEIRGLGSSFFGCTVECIEHVKWRVTRQ